MITLRLGEKSENLRKEFIAWLKSNPPPKVPDKLELDDFVEISTLWQRKLAEARWVGVNWAEEYGGRGLSLIEEALVQELLAQAGSPQLINIFGITMVGPVLIEYGTPAQKTRYLSKILSAEEIWCQGFSEPQAGSDLAALRTQAIKKETPSGNVWVISGQKIWTGFAQYADWCFMLVRTEPMSTDQAKAKHKGLSYLLVPMKSNGIDVRPLTQISGEREFNEVFLDNVQVPESNIVGRPGEGWKVAISTLMYERVILTFSRHLQSEAALGIIKGIIKDLLNETNQSKEQQLIEFGRLNAHSMAIRALALSHLLNYQSGAKPGPEGSIDKLLWSENYQEICKYTLKLLGQRSVFGEGSDSYRNGLCQYNYLYSRGRTIAAGTSEIQRNIIAERLLNLPRI